MVTTEHAYTPEEIMAYLDDELPATERPPIEAHLAGCANCQRLAGDLQSLSGQLAQWKIEAVTAERNSTMHFATRKKPTWMRAHWRWLALPSAAVVLYVGIFGIMIPASHKKTIQSYMVSEAVPLNERFAAVKVPPGHSGLVTSLAPPPSRPGEARKKELEAEDGPMIARTASMDMLVPKLEDARASLQRLLEKHQGYEVELTMQANGNVRTLLTSLRVPASQLPSTLQEMRALGHITLEEEHGEKFSAQHRDTELRLQNARETEQRLRGILGQRTGSLADVLEVEQEISRVRGEIESMEADLRDMDHRVSYATIQLSLIESSDSFPAGSSSKVSIAWKSGWKHLWESALGAAIFLEEFGPTLLFWGLLLGLPAWFGWRRYRRALKNLE